jgi:hypothetical protein
MDRLGIIVEKFGQGLVKFPIGRDLAAQKAGRAFWIQTHLTFSMTVILHGQHIKVVNTTRPVEISTNPFATLKYYLRCVSCCLPGISDLPDYVTDFSNYRNMDRDEKMTVLALATRFDLKTMVSAEIFILDRDEEICRYWGNEHFQITESRFAGLATSSVVIAGLRVEVTNVMFYTRKWAQRFFTDPLQSARQSLQPKWSSLQRKEQAARRKENGTINNDSTVCLLL